MIEVSDVIPCRTESIRLVDDELRLVVQPLDGTVVDGHLEVVEDVVLMATHHPGEVTHRLEPRVCCPPEPLGEVLLRPAGTAVFPEVAEVGPDILATLGAIAIPAAIGVAVIVVVYVIYVKKYKTRSL